MIEFEFLNKQLLSQYISSNDFGSQQTLPISKHRALSQINNPRAEENDVLLILAKEEGQLLGYTGVLPDMLFDSIKFGWLSCLWVSEEARGKNIGTLLIKKALETWENKILSADYVPFTKKLYEKTELFQENPLKRTGIRLYILADFANILPAKHSIFQKINPLLKVGDFCLNAFLKLKLNLFKSSLKQHKIEVLNELSEELIQFIIQSETSSICNRRPIEFDWIKNHPWILSGIQKDRLNEKYYFSSVDKSFNNYFVQISDSSNKIIAFLFLTERNKNLKIPYLVHNNCLETVVSVLYSFIKTESIKTFTCFDSKLADEIFKSKTPAFFQKKISRNYLVSKELSNYLNLDTVELQDGDGDCAFT